MDATNAVMILRPMSHLQCATKSRDKVACAATVQLHAATLSNEHSYIGLFSYNSMSCSVFASDHSISKLNKLNKLK